MTNKELIEILSKLPMDAEIMVAQYDINEEVATIESFKKKDITFSNYGDNPRVTSKVFYYKRTTERVIPSQIIVLNWH
jgi:hypothetical protein